MCVMFVVQFSPLGGTIFPTLGVQFSLPGMCNHPKNCENVGVQSTSHGERSELKTLEIPSSWWPAPDPPGGPDGAAKVINNLEIYVSKKC